VEDGASLVISAVERNHMTLLAVLAACRTGPGKQIKRSIRSMQKNLRRHEQIRA
jgi:hypothetical protein